jgi:hypothetical protein
MPTTQYNNFIVILPAVELMISAYNFQSHAQNLSHKDGVSTILVRIENLYYYYKH